MISGLALLVTLLLTFTHGYCQNVESRSQWTVEPAIDTLFADYTRYWIDGDAGKIAREIWDAPFSLFLPEKTVILKNTEEIEGWLVTVLKDLNEKGYSHSVRNRWEYYKSGGNNLAVLWGEISGTLDKLTVGSATSNMVSSALDQFCLKLNDSERTLQTYRQQADRSIASNVERVNAILKEIHTLNKNLERLKTDTLTMQEATLQDQRRTLLVELHSYMNVQTSETATSVTIATPNGLLLLDESVHPLTFSQFPTTIDASVLAGSGLNGIETDTGFDISHLKI